jgi:hypothetical protein
LGRPGALAGQIFRRHSRYGRVALSNLTASVLDNAPLEQPGKSASDDRAPKPRERRVFTRREREGVVLIRPPPTGGKGSLNFSTAFFRRPPPKIPLVRQTNQLHQKLLNMTLEPSMQRFTMYFPDCSTRIREGLARDGVAPQKSFPDPPRSGSFDNRCTTVPPCTFPRTLRFTQAKKFQFKLLTIRFLQRR